MYDADRSDYTSVHFGEAIALLTANAASYSTMHDLVVAVDVAPYLVSLRPLFVAVAPVMYQSTHRDAAKLVITVDLVGSCSGKVLTAKTLGSMDCTSSTSSFNSGMTSVIESEYVIARNGRMVGTPCYLIHVALTEGFEILDVRRVDDAPVLGADDAYYYHTRTNSNSNANNNNTSSNNHQHDATINTAIPSGWVATYIVTLQHQRIIQ
jgi:hypothetical protein